ncbi:MULTISPECIES: cell wall hydrolase [unclassified Aminobacter]|uniref:cell wall hydrolase n=1 Tax=unclassified Aminobacter TaxID=2644704 RepID=UPI000466B223|nr:MULTISPECIES: cell wall hydrolase [unclassified Aminobacter]TWG63104.1 spore germination cell wall hydrolase CwlJ-like protein [Aminobacter sp. J44]TWH34963.1 spore germination cell wall hydrolase CwlJ-like protein [Aminobacter sp. J15]
MLRYEAKRGRPRAGSRSLAAPLLVGLGIWIASPTHLSYQDMASYIAGLETSGARWNGYVEAAAAGSVHAAEMRFTDDTATGSISGAGLNAPGVGKVAFRGKTEVADTPDEDRINREEKRSRVVHVAPVAPPKFFNAGSIFERTSLLLTPTQEPEIKMTFVVPEIAGKEVQIASAFHVREDEKVDPGVPAFLANLVNNDKPDILATAYAPPKPDYAKASPFASILKEEQDPYAGRYIPPVGEGDHEWMKNPLPPEVFSEKEQKCLAEGIYFESRGEDVKGQAAVAQVILNRVRNPAYPNTICGVVYQNKDWRNRCQFSFACEGRKLKITDRRHYKMAQEVGMAVTAGKVFLPEVGSATHYHATYVKPGWARTMEKVKKIGLHIFYRTYGGGWS